MAGDFLDVVLILCQIVFNVIVFNAAYFCFSSHSNCNTLQNVLNHMCSLNNSSISYKHGTEN